MTYDSFRTLLASAALASVIGLAGTAWAVNDGQEQSGQLTCPETVGAFPGAADDDFRGPPADPGASGRTPPGRQVREAALCGVGALPQDDGRRRAPRR